MKTEILAVVSEDRWSEERRAMCEMLRAWRDAESAHGGPRMFTKGDVTVRVVDRLRNIAGTRPHRVVIGAEVGDSMCREAVVRAARSGAPVTHGLDGLRSALLNAGEVVGV